MTLPFLTVPDPKTTSEGVLDPLGLSGVGDQLADEILPGLRARMVRPRFLTAMAVSAAVYEGLEDELSSDGVTPPAIVFEWLLVTGFARASEKQDVRGTPGIAKARTARDEKLPMSARAYLRVPSVFGFHGVYKPLGRHLGIVDDDLRLADHGHELLSIWEREQKLSGFARRAYGGTEDQDLRGSLRRALGDALEKGFVARTPSWQAWRLFEAHLVPSQIGRDEASFIRMLLRDPRGNPRGEVFKLVSELGDFNVEEATLVEEGLLPQASPELTAKLNAIRAYEAFCRCLEEAFDWLRYLSGKAGARALSPAEFSRQKDVEAIASALPKAQEAARRALDSSTPKVQNGFLALTEMFDSVKSPEALYEAVLSRHAHVQRAKPPDGKREWFEHGPDGRVFVRGPYRMSQPPGGLAGWGRPYRVTTVSQFCNDLSRSA